MLFYVSVNHIRLVYQSENWAETNGLVISSKVCRFEGRRISYSPEIVYRYTVNGKNYESRDINYGFRDGDKREADEKVSLYPAGSQVKVFYAPSSPEQACLETGGSARGFVIPVSMGIFLMIGAVWLANRARDKNKHRLYRSF